MGVGLAAGSLVLATAVGGVLLVDGGGDDEDVITTVVADAGALEEGNEVRAAGVRVGKITEIELRGSQARMELEVDPALLPLHRDATLTVRPVNLLGESYIDLDRGSDNQPFMSQNTVPTDQVSTAVTLQDLLDTFEAPTAASLASVVSALGEGLDGNGARTSRALARLSGAMGQAERLGSLLSGQNAVLADLVSGLDPVASALASEEGRRLDGLLDSTTAALSAVTQQQDALAATIRELPATLASAQQALTQLGGVARETTPALRSLRPLTGNLRQVVAEVRDFADSADPALASLEPVLLEADRLLDEAAPVVAALRTAGPDLARAARSLRPLGRELLDENLFGVMEFVRKWSLSTNGRDGLSHYFRGVVYLTPSSLESIANSLVPDELAPAGTPGQPGPSVPELEELPLVGDLPLLGELPDLDMPLVDSLLGGGSLLSGSPRQRVEDATSALGLTTTQESDLVVQLLGGTR